MAVTSWTIADLATLAVQAQEIAMKEFDVGDELAMYREDMAMQDDLGYGAYQAAKKRDSLQQQMASRWVWYADRFGTVIPRYFGLGYVKTAVEYESWVSIYLAEVDYVGSTPSLHWRKGAPWTL